MSSVSCSANTYLLIVAVVLIVAFTDTIFQNVPVLKKLFVDSINFILLIGLVIMIILIDMPSGIVLAFLILYLSTYMNRNAGTIYGNTHMDRMERIGSMPYNNNNNAAQQRKVKFNDINTVIQSPSDSSIRSESEFIYDNTKPFPNANLMPFKPASQNDINAASASKKDMSCNGNLGLPQGDFITRVDKPSRDGYDISGCRYDFKNSPQNLSRYGPPLAQCGSYSGSQAQTCGTVFYPLNA
jgi:hypothetical protein